MSKAEEKAKAYSNSLDYYHYTSDDPAIAFNAGYVESGRDLKPVIEAAIIAYEAWHGGTIDQVRDAMNRLGELVEPIRKEMYE